MQQHTSASAKMPKNVRRTFLSMLGFLLRSSSVDGAGVLGARVGAGVGSSVPTSTPVATALSSAALPASAAAACSSDVKVPDDVVLIPGVLESKSNFIEHPDLIAQRIVRIAERVDREQVVAGTDCGYGTWVGQAAVEPEIVWAKFAAMAEGARRASEILWK